ncbi:hypothetical protein HDF16_005723 [Granulicella aggregans]|uniref:Uncharacterized protein n=1 Tax=Granulicella aggregans TaxID=474949 RepID=A0A7W7ZJL7_9BACT|nr:hypothetical protein [Granulicella aggregans]MBB5060987.1 hypothetical protein [Granulicella aggregans]
MRLSVLNPRFEVIVRPEFALPRLNTLSIQFREFELPFVEQLQRLPVPSPSAGQHTLCMGASAV